MIINLMLTLNTACRTTEWYTLYLKYLNPEFDELFGYKSLTLLN